MSKEFSNISVTGLGYIGLPTAAVFADCGRKVVGVDTDERVVKTVNSEKIHIVEPDLEKLVSSVVRKGYLRATLHPVSSDVFLITVPTPIDEKTRKPNLGFVFDALVSIAKVLKRGDLVVLESTVPLGTTRSLSKKLSKLRPDLNFPHSYGDNADVNLAHCPERVLPGKVLKELRENDRIIGGLSVKCTDRAIKLYKIFVSGRCIGASSVEVAEMSKLTENSFRDLNIAFANELSILCDEVGVNVWELIELANKHPRVNILQPGPGVGGHCIAIDPWFLVDTSSKNTQLIQLARSLNDNKPNWVIEKFNEQLVSFLKRNKGKAEKETSLNIYGLTFKPDIDDLRESPALQIASQIIESYSGSVFIVEPNISRLPKGFEQASLLHLNSLKNADFSLLLVDHKEFKTISKPSGVVIDTRGIWN